MNTVSRSILLVSMTLILVACGTSLQERGDEQLQRGNYEAAASNYEAALSEDPNDHELRRKYERAADLAVRANIEKARMAATDGDFQGAIAATSAAIEWGYDRNDVNVWGLGLDRRIADEVHRRAATNDFDGAVALADEATEHLPGRYTADTSEERDKALGTWTGWLLTEADTAAAAGARATEAVYLAEAASLTDDPRIERRAARAVQKVRSQHHVDFSVYAGQTRGSSVLSHLPDEIGSARVVRGRLESALVSVEVDLRDMKVIDDTITETRSKQYVTGYENRKSREWIGIKRDIRRLEEKLEQAEIEESRAQRAAEANPTKRARARHEAAKDKVELYEDRIRERERDLFLADEFVREEVYATHHWDVRTVTRTGLGVAYLSWTDPVTGAREVVEEPIRVSETDTAQRGYRDADVPEDPLNLASVAEMEREVSAGAAERVVVLLTQQYEVVLSDAMAEAAAVHGPTESAALGVILRPSDPPGSSGRELVRLTGVRDSIASTVGSI